MLGRGGVVFLNYQLPAIARAASFFTTTLGWREEDVPTADDRHQWAVPRTIEQRDHGPFGYFVEF